LSAVEISGIIERLRAIDETLLRIEDKRLAAIEEYLRVLNGRVTAAERWQSGGDAMFDSLNERVGGNFDRLEKFDAEVSGILRKQQTFIDQQTGGLTAKSKMVVDLVGLAMLGVALAKLFLFHN
jgi:hypothetical protein